MPQRKVVHTFTCNCMVDFGVPYSIKHNHIKLEEKCWRAWHNHHFHCNSIGSAMLQRDVGVYILLAWRLLLVMKIQRTAY